MASADRLMSQRSRDLDEKKSEKRQNLGTGNHKPDKCKQIQCFEFRTKLDIIPHPVKYARPEKVVSAVMQEVSPESELSRSSEPPGPLNTTGRPRLFKGTLAWR